MADDADAIGQEEIERLLQQAQAAAQPSSGDGPPGEAAPNAPSEVGEAGPRPEKENPPRGASAPAPSQQSPVSLAVGQDTQNHPAAKNAGDDIQFLLDQAQQAIASVDNPAPTAEGTQAFQLPELSGSAPSDEQATLDLLNDVELDVKIELGRTLMSLEDVLKLRRGSVVSLDKLAGDPVDVYVNGRLVARGEVLVLNDNFCVRVAELIAGDEG
jgi:flagellar motor switch protein FliN/FliY